MAYQLLGRTASLDYFKARHRTAICSRLRLGTYVNNRRLNIYFVGVVVSERWGSLKTPLLVPTSDENRLEVP